MHMVTRGNTKSRGFIKKMAENVIDINHRTENIRVRLTKAFKNQLDEYARKHGINISAAIRNFLERMISDEK